MQVGERGTPGRGTSERGDLVEIAKELGGDVAELVKAELAVARQELEEDARELRESAWLFGLAMGATFVGVQLVLGALVAAGRRHPSALAMLGFGLVGAGVSLGREARRSVPPLLERTRWRVVDDARRLEEGSR